MNLQHTDVLRTLGLTSTETKVYLTLLELGKALAGTIADRAHLHRRNTYDALKKLLDKGMISYTISNKKRFWNTIHPEKILFIIKENQRLVEEIMPELITKFSASKLKQTVEVFEGLDGMKTFFDDMIKTKKTIVMLFATGKAYKKLPYYMKTWDERINKQRRKVNVLLNSDGDKTPYQNYNYGQIRILPAPFSTPTQIFIYGNKSVIAIWSEDPIATMITSNEITDGFRKYFHFLWKIGKKVNYE